MKSFNPFAELTSDLLDRVLSDRSKRRQAEARFERLLASYRELLQDSRYQPVRQEVLVAVADEVEQLIQEASKCHRCAARAERIRVLRQVVQCPVESILSANESESQSLEESNDEG